MFKKSLLGSAIAFAIAAPTIASAEVETSAVLKNETAVFLKQGIRTGEAANVLDTKGDGRTIGKFENSAKIFFNGDIGEESSWHGELNLIYDAAAESGYKSHKNYSQNDWFRELYVDTTAGGWDLRLGKQQVVWGTADGIKLLDIINPTDYRELVQNTMEDARIPVWMLNAERNVGENGNFQFIVAQAKENQIPGLNSNGDSGHPFIMKGVDTITGQVNGFVNIAPALSNVAGSFSASAAGGGFTGGVANPPALTNFTGLTVDGFASGSWGITTPGQINPGLGAPDTTYADPTNTPGFAILNNMAQNGIAAGDPNGNNYVTNLTTVTGNTFVDGAWNTSAPLSAFEYMPNATFATFNTFSSTCAVGPTCFGGFTGITTQYKRDYPNAFKPNVGFRFRSSTESGLNYSVNYFYHYDANPSVDLSWRDATTGERLTTVIAASGDFINNATGAPPGADGQPDFADPNGVAPIAGAVQTGTIAPSAVLSTVMNPAAGIYPVSVLLKGSTGCYGAVDPTGGADPGTALNTGGNNPALRFTERLNRIHSIGGSFDYAFDTEAAPIVIRGEFLYDRNAKQPVIDRRLLAIGDMEHALVMKDADMFKYVLGADVTVMTNLLMSAQFIQFRNLDFVNEPRTCNSQVPGKTNDCSRHTGDFATLHLSNGLQKGWKNKGFYSFFLSKPFGDSDLGRWNNILMYEEGVASGIAWTPSTRSPTSWWSPARSTCTGATRTPNSGSSRTPPTCRLV